MHPLDPKYRLALSELEERRTFLKHCGAGVSSLVLSGCAPIVTPPVIVPPAPRPVEPKLIVVDPIQQCQSPVTPKTLNESVPGLMLTDNFPKKFALTFDDGPRPKKTGRVMEILKAYNLKATFLVCGRLVRRFPEFLKTIVAEGHTLGNHTYTHPNLASLETKEVHKEYERTQREVDKALGYHYPMVYHRPPYGSPWFFKGRGRKYGVLRQSLAIDRRNGILLLWQIHGNDGIPNTTTDGLCKNLDFYLGRGRGGAIVLHDSNPVTVRALPNLLDIAKAKGYTFCTVDELMRTKYQCAVNKVTTLPTNRRSARKLKVSLR